MPRRSVVLLVFALTGCNEDGLSSPPPPPVNLCPTGLNVIDVENLGEAEGIGLNISDDGHAMAVLWQGEKSCALAQPIDASGQPIGSQSGCLPDTDYSFVEVVPSARTNGGFWVYAQSKILDSTWNTMVEVDFAGVPTGRKVGWGKDQAQTRLIHGTGYDYVTTARPDNSHITVLDWSGYYSTGFITPDDNSINSGGNFPEMDHELNHSLGAAAATSSLVAFGVRFYDTKNNVAKVMVKVGTNSTSQSWETWISEVELAHTSANCSPSNGGRTCANPGEVKAIFAQSNDQFVVWWNDLTSGLPQSRLTTIDRASTVISDSLLPTTVALTPDPKTGGWAALVRGASDTELKLVLLDARLAETAHVTIDSAFQAKPWPHLVVLASGDVLALSSSTNQSLARLTRAERCK